MCSARHHLILNRYVAWNECEVMVNEFDSLILSPSLSKLVLYSSSMKA